jgi:hypothetical protein
MARAWEGLICKVWSRDLGLRPTGWATHLPSATEADQGGTLQLANQCGQPARCALAGTMVPRHCRLRPLCAGATAV